MDRNSILVLVVCFILLMLWYPLVNKLYPPKPLPPGATNAPAALLATTNQPATAQTAPAVLEEPSATPKPVATANVPEELLEVANANARYTFTSLWRRLEADRIAALSGNGAQAPRKTAADQ